MTSAFASWRRRLLRPVVAIPVAIVAGGAVWFAMRSTGSAASAQQVTERIVTVTSGPLRQTVSASGSVAPADVEDLSFTVGGKVTAVNVRAGQQVAKGAVLATIDSASLQSQVAQAQSSIDSATARVANDQATSASSAQLNADEASLTSAQAQLASARAALAGATLTSPIDGTVSLVNLTVGQQLGSSGGSGVGLTGSATGSGRSSAASSGSSAGSSAGSSSAQIEVVSTGSMVVNLNVDDTEIGRLAVGQKATVVPAAVGATGRTGGGRGAANAGGASTTTTVASGASGASQAPAATRVQTATGTVTSVSTIATSTSGVATFPVVVTLDGTPAGFFAGSTAQVAITYNELPDVVQVPLAAITRSNGQAYVTVVDGAKRTRRAITIGVTSGGIAQVTDGLQPDEQVVVTVPVATTSNRATTGGTRTGTGGFPGGGGGFPGGGGGAPGGGGGFRGGPND